MSRMRFFLRVVVSTVTVGSLAFATTGVANAVPVKDPSTFGWANFEKHFNCASANQRLTHAQRLELGPAVKLTGMIATETRFMGAGQTKHAAWLKAEIAKEQVRIARGMSPRFKALLDKYTGFIEEKCHVTLPAYVPPSSNGTKADHGSTVNPKAAPPPTP